MQLLIDEKQARIDEIYAEIEELKVEKEELDVEKVKKQFKTAFSLISNSLSQVARAFSWFDDELSGWISFGVELMNSVASVAFAMTALHGSIGNILGTSLAITSGTIAAASAVRMKMLQANRTATRNKNAEARMWIEPL